MKNLIFMLAIIMMIFVTMGCSEAYITSTNLSTAADQFEIYRRVVFYNGITDSYMLTIEGYCSIESDNEDNQLELVVKTGPNKYFKHFLGLSDNVTYFVEQLDSANVSTHNYKVIFRPSTIIPDIDIK